MEESKLDKIIKSFRNYYFQNFQSWKNVEDSALNVFRVMLEEIDVYAELQSRIKSIESCETNIQKYHMDNPETDMVDVCGVRCVCIFSDDLDKIETKIFENFHVEELKDKSRFLDSNKMGYQSRHFIAKLTSDSQIQFEIQLRTVMQHAWATASHKLLYKGVANTPKNIEREINNISSSLEVLQSHIDRINHDIKSHIFKIGKESTLEYLLYLDYLSVEVLNNYCRTKFGHIGTSEEWAGRVLDDILKIGIRTIKEIDEIVENTIPFVIQYSNEYPDYFKYASDYLSKCLSFARPDYLKIHPVGKLTKEKAQEFQNRKT